jgi:TolA-binding protein
VDCQDNNHNLKNPQFPLLIWGGNLPFFCEKAILEYEKAIVKYPEGDKIPSALFKQALAFLELGDKTNARNLLRRVIERYPHSDQAEMAKKRLDAIK